MEKQAFADLVAGYIGAQQLQYGNVEERIKMLDAITIKHVASMNSNQVVELVAAQRLARKHLTAMRAEERKAEERRRRAEEELQRG